jgi:hypothetical protein
MTLWFFQYWCERLPSEQFSPATRVSPAGTKALDDFLQGVGTSSRWVYLVQLFYYPGLQPEQVKTLLLKTRWGEFSFCKGSNTRKWRVVFCQWRLLQLSATSKVLPHKLQTEVFSG